MHFSKSAEPKLPKPAKDLVTKKGEKQARYYNKGAKRQKDSNLEVYLELSQIQKIERGCGKPQQVSRKSRQDPMKLTSKGRDTGETARI